MANARGVGAPAVKRLLGISGDGSLSVEVGVGLGVGVGVGGNIGVCIGSAGSNVGFYRRSRRLDIEDRRCVRDINERLSIRNGGIAARVRNRRGVSVRPPSAANAIPEGATSNVANAKANSEGGAQPETRPMRMEELLLKSRTLIVTPGIRNRRRLR